MTKRITEGLPDEQGQLEIEEIMEWRSGRLYAGALRAEYGVRMPSAVCKHCGCRVVLLECTPWVMLCPLCRKVLVETVATL